MWPFFLISGAVIIGGWIWGASKVAKKEAPLPNDPSTDIDLRGEGR